MRLRVNISEKCEEVKGEEEMLTHNNFIFDENV